MAIFSLDAKNFPEIKKLMAGRKAKLTLTVSVINRVQDASGEKVMFSVDTAKADQSSIGRIERMAELVTNAMTNEGRLKTDPGFKPLGETAG